MHGYLDGELGLAESLEVERHMRECQSCARAYRGLTTLRSALKDGPPYYPAPAKLCKSIATTLRQADAASADQHAVKPRFDGQIDFAPQVADFSGQGYPLVGGRIEYLNNRTVVALVYQRHKHFINVFIWPAQEGADSGAELSTPKGYNLVHWIKSGMTYCAVSDLNSADLQELARLIQGEAPPS
jgi:anti-sigma factor RsiW